jgi:hypothetical protein
VAVLGDPGPEGRWEGPVDGLPAATRFVREGQRGAFSFLRCTLETGRTHQIRQHALAAGTPVVGDRRYGGAAGRAWPRLALHAAVLRFPHPRTGVPVQVLSPLPADLCALFGEDPPPVERQRRSAARAAEAKAAGVDSDGLDDDLDDLDGDLDEDLDGEGEE